MTIEMDRVTRINGYGTKLPHVVLHDASVAFPAGKTTGVLGLRGSGKTTLIKLLSGIVTPTGGVVRRRGSVSWPVGSFGWMHRFMTGRENLYFLSRIYSLDPQPVIDFVQAVSDLGSALDQPVSLYSGDKRSRLAFAASYAVPFDVYLADEYLIGGPPGFREVCRTLVRERQQSATIVMATRSPALVRLFCDHAAVLQDGQVRMCQTVQEAINLYATMRDRHDAIGEDAEPAGSEPAPQIVAGTPLGSCNAARPTNGRATSYRNGFGNGGYHPDDRAPGFWDEPDDVA